MQMIILYGPPGVGKLTVARELATRTGYRVLHNHLTVDLVTSLFPFGSPEMWRLVKNFRLDMLAAAAESDLEGVIFTFVYGLGHDDEMMARFIETVESRDGRVTLVLLTADREIVLDRTEHESRAAFGKLRDREIARDLMNRETLDAPYPHRPSLVIDNTHLAPAEVADRIANELTSCP